DETSPILKTFITGLENQLSLKVKVIRSDNGTEFKNNDLNQFCGMKGIKREFSIPRTPQQNGIAERKNRTLIEATRTMLADLLLPIPFWAEAVNTACYVQNKVLVTKPHNKTPYELLHGRTPSIGFMRPFGCLVTILNTLDSLGKFEGKVDEGFLEHDFDAKKPESEVNVSPSNSAQSKKQDDKTKKEAKGKSHVESFTRNKDLSAEFEDCSNNSSNEVTATVSPIPTTRIHKDHLVSQIIGDLSSTTQTRSMTSVVKDQDSLLPIPFWAEAVNTACYVQNRVLVTKHQNKTPYELLHGGTPSVGFMRPFGCPVTILNTLDSLGKFDGKVDEGFLVGYSVSSKAFRVFNSKTRIIQETLHINFLENKPNVAGSGPTWLFDIDTLTKTLNYQPVTTGNQSKPSVEFEDFSDDSINKVNVAGSLVPAVGQISTNITNTFSVVGPSNADVSPTHGKSSYVDSSQLPNDLNMPKLEDITYSDDEEDVGAEADFTNLETAITVSLIPTTRVHKDHHVIQIIGDLSSATQTRSMTRVAKDQGGLSQINNDDFHTCMFSCFLSQEEPKREEGIDYEEVFAPVARIEAIRLFLAYASFMGFMVYQMDVKSAFMYGTVEEEVYVFQPLGFEDPDYPDKKLMKEKFQMSLMGKLTFFLGIQVKQKKDGIFINQDKYIAEILRKFGLTDGKSPITPIDTEKPLLKDPDGEDVDEHIYRSMIGSLM
nr:retrovirus-related Pol polyprotein from transposon TNT 1-94 [Tanacetum cinerariifolium]